MSDNLLLLTQSPFEEKWYKLSIGSIRASILTSILETYGSMLHTHDNLSVLNMLSVDGSGKLLFNGLPVGGGGEHIDTSDFVTLSTAQTVTGDKTFASDVIPGGQKTDGTRGRLFLPSSLGTGAVDIFVDTETGIDGETPEPGAGGNAAWEVSTHRAHAVLNVSGERKEVALYGHRHTVSEISGLLGTDGLILSSLLPSVQSPVTSVAGLTGDITVSALRDALTDTDHLFVTSAEKSLWTSKWTWSEEAVKAVKVNNAVNADKLGGVLASDYVRTAALEDFCEGYLMWGALPQDNGSIQMTNGLGQSRSVSLHGHHHAVSDVDTGDGWDALLGSAAPSTLSGWGITDAYTKAQVSQILGNYLPLAGGTMSGDITFSTGAIYLGTADGFDRTIVGYNETSGAMLFFDGTRTVVGSYGAHSTAATHIRSKTGHATIGAGNTASYTILDTGNYTATLDGRYLLKSTYTASDILTKLKTVDGSGSGLDADLLDGTQKSGLLTSVTSTSAANLSVTVGGTVKSVADLYATFLGGKTLAQVRTGMSFLTSSFTAAGWYRVFTSEYSNVAYCNEVILHIGRTYTSPQNEHYSFSICVGYNGDISITQLSGVMGGHIITKIRVVWDNSQKFYIDVYVTGKSNGYSNTYGVTGQGYGTFSAFTSGASIPDGYTAYEFTTVDGCKSDRGFTGTLTGNASSATRLATARTLWGQSFNGTANVSGAMTGVTSIDSSLFDLTTATFQLYDSASQAKRFTFNWSSDIARIYAINNSGSGYYDMSLGQTPGNSGALYFDASAAAWGIGTTSPAYKLHVIGSGYFSSTLKTASELNANTVRISATSATAHLAFGRANYNYITAPSGGGIAFVTNGKEVSGDNTDMYVGDGRVSVGGSLSSEKLYVPSSLGNEVFDIYVDTEVNIDGEVPVSGGGLDVDSLWTELSGSADGRVISGSHIPLATSSSNGGIRTGYSGTGKNYPVRLNSTGQAYVSVPWENTTYTLAGLGGVPTSRKVNGLALSSDITLDGADIRLTGYSEGSSTAVVAATDTVNAAIAKLQNQIQTKQASGSYMTTDTSQSITGLKISITNPWAVRMTVDTSNYVNGLVWKNTSGTNIAAIGYYNAGKRIFINSSYPDMSDDIWMNATGDYTLMIGRGDLTYNGYTILRSDNIGSYALTKSNYTSTLDGRYMRIGSSGYPTAYRKVFNVNGTAWSFLGTTTDAPTIYAPTTAGTSGYVLQSTGGTPAWAAQNSLVVKGIYERSLGVAVGDTMADLKSALTAQMNSGLNKPGSMGYTSSSSIANIMSNWTNDDYELVAGSRTNFLRLDGYGSSTYGVFLVSGYQGSFYRLLKNSSTAWGGPYLILDTGNYANTLDSRYVNVSGDTMTGKLTVPSLYANTHVYVYESSNHENRLTLNWTDGIARIYAIGDSGSGYYDMSLGHTPGNSGALYFDASTARWGIGITSPVYKLDVAGTLRATGRITAAGLTSSASIVANAGLSTTTLSASGAATLSSTLSVSGLIKALDGVQIDSTSDIGWYNHNSRIAAGINTARGVNVGSLLVSSAWSDYTKVPENGIYSKGEIVCSSDIYPDVTASVKLGSVTKRWLGVYAQNGSFSGSVSVSSLNVVTEATVKTLVPDKLHLPSSLGNEVFDIYVDTEVNIDGETPVSVSFEPLWYGLVSSSGSASKMGGSATVSVTHSDTGYYVVKGVPSTACVIAVPALITAGIAATQYRYSATVTRMGDGCTVNMFAASDARADYGFYLMII